jgi:hypothetical protein
MRVKVKLQKPQIDVAAYRKEFELKAKETMSLAILSYLDTAQNVIPVWSGASIASFKKLAGLISAPLIINPSDSVSDRPGVNARRQSEAVSRSDARTVVTSTAYGFSFETDLPHLVYNENNNANVNPDPTLFGVLLNPGPYGFTVKAKEAVIDVLARFDPPDILKFIKK